MAGNDYQGFRWTEATCGRHFKLMPISIVGKDGPRGWEPSIWASMGSSAQAVLPVLLRHANQSGTAYPGEGRLAAMAGLSRKTARQATRKLEDLGLIEIFNRTSRQGRRCKTYRFKVVPGDKGILMPSIFIDSGLWHCLKPASKALAVAFRMFAKSRPGLDPDYDEDSNAYGTWLDKNPDNWREYLEQRTFDFCTAEPSVLREYAGIGLRIYPKAIKDLQNNFFIEPDPNYYDYWRVMVWPEKIKKVSYLNAQIDGETGPCTQNTPNPHYLPTNTPQKMFLRWARITP